MTKMRKLNEEYKPVIGYEELYLLSSSGNLVSLRWNRVLKITRSTGNYRSVSLSKDGKSTRFLLHRLLATHFIPNPNNYEMVNHIDGDPTNYSLSNLEWCTCKQNIHHALKNGLFKGKKIWRLRLVEMDVNTGFTTVADDYNSLASCSARLKKAGIAQFKVKKKRDICTIRRVA